MIPLLEQHRPAIEALCRKYGVTRLEVFGSATDPTRFDVRGEGTSDIDFLYEIDIDLPELSARYFGFLEALQATLRRNVELVSIKYMRNPYFVTQVNAEREALYAA